MNRQEVATIVDDPSHKDVIIDMLSAMIVVINKGGWGRYIPILVIAQLGYIAYKYITLLIKKKRTGNENLKKSR